MKSLLSIHYADQMTRTYCNKVMIGIVVIFQFHPYGSHKFEIELIDSSIISYEIVVSNLAGIRKQET